MASSNSGEQEPLLGRPGDVSQGEKSIFENLILGSFVSSLLRSTFG
jgi:hypothetical protein